MFSFLGPYSVNLLRIIYLLCIMILVMGSDAGRRAGGWTIARSFPDQQNKYKMPYPGKSSFMDCYLHHPQYLALEFKTYSGSA